MTRVAAGAFGFLTTTPLMAQTSYGEFELADQIRSENLCAVSGHHTSPDGLTLGCTVLFK